ncbi:MAG: hypothetical protein DWQ02_20755 [Bacteroidetes bacterium]|nr:MAG: hypothetical protein DWQ02_20755 [Bacteroidota bacterium]
MASLQAHWRGAFFVSITSTEVIDITSIFYILLLDILLFFPTCSSILHSTLTFSFFPENTSLTNK